MGATFEPALLASLAAIDADERHFPMPPFRLPVSGAMVQMPTFKPGHARRLGEDIIAWANTYRINCVWVTHYALWTLQVWAYDATAREARRWVFPPVTGVAPATAVHPVMPEPLNESRQAALARFQRAWDQRVAELEAADYIPAARKDVTHVDWLAWRTVGRRSVAAIARRAGRQPHTVSEALQRTAQLIDLTLPPR